MKLLIGISLILTVSGCVTPRYEDYYKHTAASEFPPTTEVKMFYYPNADYENLYDLFFKDYLLIGKTGLRGKLVNPENGIPFAKSIGADLYVATAQFKDTKTKISSISLPSSNSTYINGNIGNQYFSGTATTYGINTVSMPVEIDRYDQYGMYLKNVNNIKPFWEGAISDYKKTSENINEGTWINTKYDIEVDVFQSGENMVGFYKKSVKDKPPFINLGDIKFIYGVKTGKGIYLMRTRKPVPATFKIDTFEQLTVDLEFFDFSVAFSKL